jgi:hypothetical protein
VPRPPLTIPLILAWADDHHEHTGDFPHTHSGPLLDRDEVWSAIDGALRLGGRGLPGKSSLPRLLAEHRGYVNKRFQPPLTIPQILQWADAWNRRHGHYPRRTSGPIPRSNGETWANVGDALVRGHRGLTGGSSLARLLSEERGVPNEKALPHLTIRQILLWCDAHHRRTGKWPKDRSGPIPEAQGTTWQGVDLALRRGQRGLPGGSSLPRLLVQHRGVKNEKDQAPLTIKGIWAWMVSHHCRTSRWPNSHSGRIAGTRWETWAAVDSALRHGRRGLPGQSSLLLLLREKLAEATVPEGDIVDK